MNYTRASKTKLKRICELDKKIWHPTRRKRKDEYLWTNIKHPLFLYGDFLHPYYGQQRMRERVDPHETRCGGEVVTSINGRFWGCR
jgi:hypothetical protein